MSAGAKMGTASSGKLHRIPLAFGGVAAWVALLLWQHRHSGHIQNGSTAPDISRDPTEQALGRGATTPEQIPARGWRHILRRVYVESLDDRITTVAAGITFFSLLALFPAITALVSLYGLIADPAAVRDHLFALSFMLPAGTFQIVEDQVSRILAQGEAELGFKLAIGLAIALWGANAGVKAAIDGLNIAYEETEKRGFLMLNALSLTFTFAAILLVLAAAGMVTVAPLIIAELGLPPAATWAIAAGRWVLTFVVLTVALSVIYRFGPSRENARWRWVTWGSAVAAMLWILVSISLSIYLSRFTDYNATYGSLGAAVALMMWIWLSSCAVLIGAELNAEIEHQTAQDTTTGPPAPMGLRGARMADTVA